MFAASAEPIGYVSFRGQVADLGKLSLYLRAGSISTVSKAAVQTPVKR